MRENFKRFYRGKQVLVTGADGFMGSHLVEQLLDFGARVSVFIRGTSVVGTVDYNNLKNIKHLIKKFSKIIAGNIASKDSIDLLRSASPQIIFHLAAEAYVPKSFDQPLEVFDVNLGGTLNVLEASRGLKNIKRIVITSSSEVYGPHPKPISEKNILNPTSPYGASKVAADRAAYSWHITYGLPVAIIRPFNTYGPRHTYDVVPKFINLALKNQPITIYGSGEQTRDFTYVSDTVRGFLLMGSHPKAAGETVNFGTGKYTTINELTSNIIEISGSKSKIIHNKTRLAEVKNLICDSSKAKKLFNWSPRVNLKEGLKSNILWVKSNPET